MKKRKSRHCPKWCDGIGCFESYEKRTIFEKERMVWVLHCKELEKIHKKILRKF